MSINIAGIEITHPDKIIYPALNITKLEMVKYYEKVSDKMLKFLKDRPLTLHRFPNGVNEEGFYQKNASDYFPTFVKTVEIETEGKSISQVVCNTKRTLIYLVNQGTVSFHIWGSKIDMINKPDRIVFDLDPSSNNFDEVKEAAKIVRKHLKSKGEKPQIMTTGQSGLHVFYKIRRTKSFDEAKAEAKIYAQRLEKNHPEIFTTALRKDKRDGKIFLDYLRNAYGQTAICPYSLRPNAIGGIATPIPWSHLNDLKASDQFNISNLKK
ncbi:MAG TPA: non-homologous end-joining DNA ligase [Flavobacteriaceae bacterium]|nr:non-homologous end-joining DNA ligase [Flavobacteriaceae bacterium]